MLSKLKTIIVTGKKILETIIESYNGYLQAIAILYILYVTYYGAYLGKSDTLELIIQLLTIIVYEIMILSIKDSIAQSKLNDLLVISNSINQLVPSCPQPGEAFDDFIRATREELFISGISCNNIWFYMNRIVELLDRGCTIRLLISDEDTIDENARFYFGCKNEEKDSENAAVAVRDVKSKIDITLNYLKLNDAIHKYYCNKQFEIRRTNQPFTMSFIGIDLNSMTSNRKLKVTQYTYGCGNTFACPSFLLVLPEHRHWFNYYHDIIKEQWRKSIPYELTDCKVKR